MPTFTVAATLTSDVTGWDTDDATVAVAGWLAAAVDNDSTLRGRVAVSGVAVS